jgi:hypothetical protein
VALDADDSLARLAQALPLGRRLDGVIDRVADQVQHGREQPLAHRLVELCAVGLDLEADFLAGRPAQPSHHQRHPLEQLVDRDHPRAHDRCTQVAQALAALLHDVGELAHVDPARGQLCGDPGQAKAGDDQRRQTLERIVEAGHRHAHHAAAVAEQVGLVGQRVAVGGIAGLDRTRPRSHRQRQHGRPIDAGRGGQRLVVRPGDHQQRERDPAGRLGRPRHRKRHDLDQIAQLPEALAHRRDVEAALAARRARHEVDAHGAPPLRGRRAQLLGLGRAHLLAQIVGDLHGDQCVHHRARRRRHLGAGGKRSHAGPNGAHPADQEIDRLRLEPPLAAVGDAQRRLHGVGELDHRLDADHRGQPLDRVHRSKQLSHRPRGRLAGRGQPLRLEQVATSAAQVLFDLEEVTVQELLEVERAHAG